MSKGKYVLEWKSHNYTLEYKNWKFKLSESEGGDYFFVNIFYKDNLSSMFVNPRVKTAEDAKERVENFIETELK